MCGKRVVNAQLISVFVFTTYIVQSLNLLKISNCWPLVIFCCTTALFMSGLLQNLKDEFSHDNGSVHMEAH